MQNREWKDDVMQGHESRNEDSIHPGKSEETDSPPEPPKGIRPVNPLILAHWDWFQTLEL